MLRIGLLISNLVDDAICEFCQGAIYAAEQQQLALTIMPGGTLPQPGKTQQEDNYDYQQNCVFDYVSPYNVDALIIDINRLETEGSKQVRNDFLRRFEEDEIPFLTITKEGNYPAISCADNPYNRQSGYQAVMDIIHYSSSSELAPRSSDQDIPKPEITENESLHQLALLANRMLHSDIHGNIFNEIIRVLQEGRMQDAVLLMYGEGQTNTPSRPWIIPERILVRGILSEGHDLKVKKGTVVDTLNFLGESSDYEVKPGGWIARVIYMDDKQLGIFANRVSNVFLIPHFEQLLYEILEASILKSMSAGIIQNLSEEVLTLQEEVERDDSILDRIGEKDYMTDVYNRRGFFTHAYDYLRKEYHSETYAIIVYVNLDTIRIINERFGRDEGNYTVRKVAANLKGLLRSNELLGRIRGDEFAMLIITDSNEKENKIRAQMQQLNARLMAEAGKPYSIHIMFTVNSFPYRDGYSLSDMLKETDDKLRAIKEIM